MYFINQLRAAKLITYMFNWVLISFVVEPAEPFCRYHGPVIVNIVLRVVYDPPATKKDFLMKDIKSKSDN